MKLRKTILDHHPFMQDITRLKNSDVYQNMTHIYIYILGLEIYIYEYQYGVITII